jgi:hypothetical protein
MKDKSLSKNKKLKFSSTGFQPVPRRLKPAATKFLPVLQEAHSFVAKNSFRLPVF